MKIAVCEDERYWSDLLKSALSKWAECRNIKLQCCCFSTPINLIAHLKNYSDIDAVLLDIALGNEVIDGVVAAKYIRKMGNDTPIIFFTADLTRAVDGYLVEAMGFIGKPIDEKRLSLFLDRLLKSKKAQKFITINNGTGTKKIPVNSIIYAEIINHDITICTTKTFINTRKTLIEMLAELGNESFVQIHRSYIISKSKISSIKTTYPYSVDLLNGAKLITLSVSKNHIENLLAVYSENILEKMI